MKKLLIAAALAVCSCTAPTPAPQVEVVSIDATKALTIAADAYTTVATATQAAVEHGAFSPAQLQQIDSLNDKALALLQGSDKTLTAAQRASGLILIVTQLHSILGK